MNQMPAIINTASSRVLLAVDSNRQVQQLLRHAFHNCFDHIYTAGTVTEADMILRNFQMTHLLCELDLERHNDGLSLTAKWRKMYPGILRVCIFCGSEFTHKPLPKHIDGVYFKGDSLTGLKSLLLSSHRETNAASRRIREIE